jgi:hypothetical protein
MRTAKAVGQRGKRMPERGILSPIDNKKRARYPRTPMKNMKVKDIAPL